MIQFIEDGIKQLRIPYSINQLEKLNAFYNELSVWNPKTGFVKAEGEELVIKHFFDSLAGISSLAEVTFNTAADVGSGAGFPGIPLSIFFPDKKFTLIERSGKKCSFLENCKIILSLDNVEIIQEEVEKIETCFDIITFRAFRNFNEYIDSLFAILNKSGYLLAYKGKLPEIEKEINDAKLENAKIIPVKVPFLEEERHIVLINKL